MTFLMHHLWRCFLPLIAMALWGGQVGARADELTGTLKKVKAAGAVTVGYRESSIPFSFVVGQGEPIGYSIDLCRNVVAAMSAEVGRELAIKWVAVSSETRIPAVVSGQVDLECGSTTNNAERRTQVAFSPTTFVAGTKLMVKRGSPTKSFRDLVGKTIVVTAGTTNEKAIRDLSEKFKLNYKLVVSKDHAESFALLASGQADAFATDDVLLYGLLAKYKAQAGYLVVGDFLSYEPYGIVYRKGDAALNKLVVDAFASMADERQMEQAYNKWFLGRLPSGERINMPMSAQLESLIQTMSSKPEGFTE